MIQNNQYAIGTTAARVSAVSQTPKQVSLHTVSGTLYVGGSDAVTTTTGLLLEKAAGVVTLQIDANDELWIISGGGTHTVTVLERFL